MLSSSSSSSRRDVLATAFGGGCAAIIGSQLMVPQPAFAAAGGPTKEELARIVVGYKQINYLLEHFDVRIRKKEGKMKSEL